MTSVEQHAMVRQLREYEPRMNRDDLEIFQMYRKRDKDDEDLDEMSKKKLKELFEKYVRKPRPASNPLDKFFGK
jgi:hypothetical protein